jgi:hypothetical protein
VANVNALRRALTGWDDAAVMPPHRYVCHLDLADKGGPTRVAQRPEHPQLRCWPKTLAAEGIAYVAPPLQASFDGGRHDEVPALGQHTEASRAEVAA